MTENLQNENPLIEENLKKMEVDYRQEIKAIQSFKLTPSKDIVDFILKNIHSEDKKEEAV